MADYNYKYKFDHNHDYEYNPDLIVEPIDPDIMDSAMFLDMNWYNQPKLPGFSFLIRAKNEATNIGQCLGSIQKHLPANVPYELIVINNGSTDATGEIAKDLIRTKRGDKVVSYPYRISKPGLENYYTPVDSIHSFVYFTQFGLMQCSREWIFRWDADFEMTADLGRWLAMIWGDHTLKQQHGDRTFDYILVPAQDQDGITNAEMYLFQTKMDPFFYRSQIWEQVGFLTYPVDPQGHPLSEYFYRETPQNALILHQSTLKVIKPAYLEAPWWQKKLAEPEQYPQNYLKILADIEANCQKFIKTLPSHAQTFCRSMDPKPVEVVQQLPFTQQYSQVYDVLKQMRNEGCQTCDSDCDCD